MAIKLGFCDRRHESWSCGCMELLFSLPKFSRGSHNPLHILFYWQADALDHPVFATGSGFMSGYCGQKAFRGEAWPHLKPSDRVRLPDDVYLFPKPSSDCWYSRKRQKKDEFRLLHDCADFCDNLEVSSRIGCESCEHSEVHQEIL